MTMIKNAADTLLSMAVTEGVTVTILPNSEHEFLMTTKEVAAGYGVCRETLQKVLARHTVELINGKHYLSGVTICHRASPGASKGTLWTKRGIVRLGFFIRSERARLFRDWAEDLVLAVADRSTDSPKLPERRACRINRLTPDRIIDLLSDVCLIEDKSLRERIANKLKGGFEYGTDRKRN